MQVTIDEKDAQRRAELADQNMRMQSLIDAAVNTKEEYLQLYIKESKLRKALHNKIIDMQGNIRVICRVRPILEVEKRNAGDGADVTSFGLTSEEIFIHRDIHSKQKFEFDHVFQSKSNQIDVFNAVQPLCVSVLDGYNVCIFACKMLFPLYCKLLSNINCYDGLIYYRWSNWQWENVYHGGWKQC